MTLEPLLNASPAIQFHVLTVVPAALIGAAMLMARKGTFAHRMAGRVWVLLMVLTALSSLFIHTIRTWGPFSPIHLLSLVVLASAVEIVRTARQRRIARHKRIVKILYFGGLGIAGLFTLWPGRIMHEVVFGDAMTAGVAKPAHAATSLVSHIAGGAPWWVWPLLAALMLLGLSRARAREMPVWRLMIIPAVLTSLTVIHSVTGPWNASSAAAQLAGLLAGAITGWWSMRAVEAVRLAGNRVRVKGELVSLFAILCIFSVRFSAGTLAAVAPDIMKMQGVTELYAFVPVFCAAVMAARALAQAGLNPFAGASGQLTRDAEC